MQKRCMYQRPVSASHCISTAFAVEQISYYLSDLSYTKTQNRLFPTSNAFVDDEAVASLDFSANIGT